MTVLALDPLDLAALLCSRVCHDVISPVGAIINGLEVLDEENDAEMRGFALELIKKSAEQASARLQFCRLAFGAAGSAGASIDTGDAEKVARGLFSRERTELTWNMPHVLMPKNKVKLILNLCLIASAAIPRGGIIEVALTGSEDTARITVAAKGTNAKLATQLPALLAGAPEHPPSGPQDIQAYYTGLVAKAADMMLTVTADADFVRIEAEAIGVEAVIGAMSDLTPQPDKNVSRETVLSGSGA
ncbi:MAG TPA: histidine phosphotransferase family protein [Methylocella sp.]|nr:histidine phosphotransferase family protein [Methylocella sp.]